MPSIQYLIRRPPGLGKLHADIELTHVGMMATLSFLFYELATCRENDSLSQFSFWVYCQCESEMGILTDFSLP